MVLGKSGRITTESDHEGVAISLFVIHLLDRHPSFNLYAGANNSSPETETILDAKKKISF